MSKINASDRDMLTLFEKGQSERMLKLDNLLLGALTLVYTLIALLNLGTLSFPTTVYRGEAGEGFTLDFGREVTFDEVWFNGNVALTFFISFLINMAVCTSFDFLTGMAVNQDYSLWDYRALPFNFMGQVCLQNSLVYSIAATVIVWWVYPAMDALLTRMPRRASDGVFFAHFGMYLFLAMLHFVVV